MGFKVMIELPADERHMEGRQMPQLVEVMMRGPRISAWRFFRVKPRCALSNPSTLAGPLAGYHRTGKSSRVKCDGSRSQPLMRAIELPPSVVPVQVALPTQAAAAGAKHLQRRSGSIDAASFQTGQANER
jgi:hypothetical protein